MAVRKHTVKIAMLMAAVTALPSRAILTWPNCAEVTNANFTAVTLSNRGTDMTAEPMKMAFDLLAAKTEDAKGKVDVYFTERLGKVRKFDSKTGKVLTLATISLKIDAGTSSDGVHGIALDPGFKTNHFVYIYYSNLGTTDKAWRVSRFTLNADHTVLDLASEVVVLKVPISGGSKHPGGALQFDAYGDLWIGTGNDAKTDDFPTYSSPNTNDLRGKILRIHPTADGKYTIPEGNLFKPGTEKTRPEIYVMGNRNPYSITLDPVRRWLTWGDVGPDDKDMDGKAINGTGQTMKTEEYDLATAPGNYGYPFFSGDYQTKSSINAAAPAMPANTDWGTSGPGLQTLPPAIAPIYAYKRACAITGPIYRYDGDLNSSNKFPPHFTRKWLVTDFNSDNAKITAFTLNDGGTAITAQENVIGIPLHAPEEMQFGPDGALYVINYNGYRSSGPNTAIIRIDYGGECRPLEPKVETTATVAIETGGRGLAGKGPQVQVTRASGLLVTVATEGAFSLDVRDLSGRLVLSRQAKGPAPIALSEVRQAGVYFLQVRNAEGERSLKIVRD
ncbi:MAG: PQQ-dependent sugar dehydrogenase [Fibrobacteria bacterium]